MWLSNLVNRFMSEYKEIEKFFELTNSVIFNVL